MGECVQIGAVGRPLPMRDFGFQTEPITSVILIQTVLAALNGDGVDLMLIIVLVRIVLIIGQIGNNIGSPKN